MARLLARRALSLVLCGPKRTSRLYYSMAITTHKPQNASAMTTTGGTSPATRIKSGRKSAGASLRTLSRLVGTVFSSTLTSLRCLSRNSVTSTPVYNLRNIRWRLQQPSKTQWPRSSSYLATLNQVSLPLSPSGMSSTNSLEIQMFVLPLLPRTAPRPRIYLHGSNDT